MATYQDWLTAIEQSKAAAERLVAAAADKVAKAADLDRVKREADAAVNLATTMLAAANASYIAADLDAEHAQAAQIEAGKLVDVAYPPTPDDTLPGGGGEDTTPGGEG